MNHKKQQNNKTINDREEVANLDQSDTQEESGDVDLTPQATMALRHFFDQLTLSEHDRNSLFLKRGLNNHTIDALGFKSNPDANQNILQGLEKLFSKQALIESGLWKKPTGKPEAEAAPDPQFHGMSIVEKRDEKGKKVRDANGETIRVCEWNHPIIIPYFNEKNQLVHLRPHKGMMAGKSPRLYIPRSRDRIGIGSSIGSTKFAIITEGEFKAAALWQVLGDVAEIAALPGITMAKTLFAEVLEWLEDTGVRQVVIAYDNENKGDPNLPGYQREKHRRHDTEVWARYLAKQLSKEGFEAKVAHLPDEWRDEKGKADWDGSLASLIKNAQVDASSLDAWNPVRQRIHAEFMKVIHSAIAIGQSKYIRHPTHPPRPTRRQGAAAAAPAEA